MTTLEAAKEDEVKALPPHQPNIIEQITPLQERITKAWTAIGELMAAPKR